MSGARLVGDLLGRRVPQGRHAEPGGDQLAGRRRSAYALSTSVAEMPEWTTSTASRGGSGIGSISRLRQSISSALPRRPASDAS